MNIFATTKFFQRTELGLGGDWFAGELKETTQGRPDVQ